MWNPKESCFYFKCQTGKGGFTIHSHLEMFTTNTPFHNCLHFFFQVNLFSTFKAQIYVCNFFPVVDSFYRTTVLIKHLFSMAKALLILNQLVTSAKINSSNLFTYLKEKSGKLEYLFPYLQPLSIHLFLIFPWNTFVSKKTKFGYYPTTKIILASQLQCWESWHAVESRLLWILNES